MSYPGLANFVRTWDLQVTYIASLMSDVVRDFISREAGCDVFQKDPVLTVQIFRVHRAQETSSYVAQTSS